MPSERTPLPLTKLDREKWVKDYQATELALGAAPVVARYEATVVALDAELAAERAAHAQAMAELQATLNEVARKRGEAETKWHAHQKNVPCGGCKDGHDTFWKSVVESPQWKAWTASSPEWDVDECEACGHISQGHFQAFMKFSRRRIRALGGKP